MPDVAQSDILWAELPEPAGRRPVLILTRTDALPHLTNVTIAPLTRNVRGIPSEVDLDRDDGVPTPCAVSLDNILTIPQAALGRKVASLPTTRMAEVFDAVRYAFAMT